jgi:hypothetical protein
MKVNGKIVNHTNRKLIRVKKCSTFRLARKIKNTGSLQQFETCLRGIFFETVETSGFITPCTITSQKNSSLELPSLGDDTPSINETSATNRIRRKIKINKDLESICINLNPLFDEVADVTEE